MKLLRLHIENFGTLADYDLDLREGLNLLYQPNGWGKSTLAVFIKAMLYGLPTSSKRSLDENERKKYTPWQGGVYGGSLEFVCQKGAFRVERFFAAKESGDTFALYDLATNLPSNAFSASLGEELFGVDADGFERTTYLSQRETGPVGGNNSISAKLGNLLDDVDDIGSFDEALEALEKRRRFYVMTGNRGAIAEAEQEKLEKTHEAERLSRVREALQAQEEERRELADELGARQKLLAATQEQLREIGALRERAAQIEHKNRMMEELAELTQQKKTIKEAFGGLIPTASEYAEANRVYEELKSTHARLGAIPTVSPDAETLADLRRKYPRGVPARERIDKLSAANAQLRALRERRSVLQGAQTADPSDVRFAKGIPADARIEAGFTRLGEAKKHQQNAVSYEERLRAIPAKKPVLPLSIAAIAVGAVGLILAFLPALGGARIALGLVGALFLLAGAILLPTTLRRNKQRVTDVARLERAIAKNRAAETAALQEVAAFLNEYGMSPAEDPDRALAELRVLATQYRATLRQRERIAAELVEVDKRYDAFLEYLRASFPSTPRKEDYQEELDTLLQESTLLARLEADELRRINDRATAEQAIKDLQEQLLPFLRRYDPQGKLRAGDCLAAISEQMAEHHRVSADLQRKERQLRQFMQEKKLDGNSVAVTTEEIDRTRADEIRLQKEIAALQEKQANLTGAIDRLETEVDRLPAVNEQIRELTDRISRYKENSATISATEKFLSEAKVALSTRYLGGMQESFDKFMAHLLGDSAPESALDASFEVRLREKGQSRTMESFSRGWRDTVRFCLRLALSDALYAEGEKPFLLLDDPFVNLDEQRLAAARKLLSALSNDYQILYMMCHFDHK